MLYVHNSAYWYQDIAPWNVFGFLHQKKVKQRRCLLRRYKSVSYLINIHSLEWCLQKLKIVNVFMLQLRLKFYFLQTNAAWEEHVHELAVGCSWKETRTDRLSLKVPRVTERCWAGGSPTSSALLLCAPLLPAPTPPGPPGLGAGGQGWVWMQLLHLLTPNHCGTDALHDSITGFHEQWTELHSLTCEEIRVRTTLLRFSHEKKGAYFSFHRAATSSKSLTYIREKQPKMSTWANYRKYGAQKKNMYTTPKLFYIHPAKWLRWNCLTKRSNTKNSCVPI